MDILTFNSHVDISGFQHLTWEISTFNMGDFNIQHGILQHSTRDISTFNMGYFSTYGYILQHGYISMCIFHFICDQYNLQHPTWDISELNIWIYQLQQGYISMCIFHFICDHHGFNNPVTDTYSALFNNISASADIDWHIFSTSAVSAPADIDGYKISTPLTDRSRGPWI